MYLYFMPLPVNLDEKLLSKLPKEGEREEIQVPTSDGGVEVTEAQFLPASEWLSRSQKGEIILFPPQYLLLHLVSGFPIKRIDRTNGETPSSSGRVCALWFSPWTDMFISPKVLKMTDDGRSVLALNEPGPELKGSDRQGESERVVVVRFQKGSVREVSVRWKKDIMTEGRESSSHL
ncbi:hypothetical protein N7470_000896 [Penicillium chermesinum]|nr:hypothetical protein N7470_000896 [Penicillium chermesinum]